MTALDTLLLPADTAPAVFTGGPATPQRSLVDVLAATTAAHPDAPALDDGSRVVSYRELGAEIDRVRGELAAAGVGRGDRVGIRLPSGTAELYVAILGVLSAGAAYVPVDVDDPADRADLVFAEAGVRVVLDGSPLVGTDDPAVPTVPTPDDDAWIIFTSGSTGRPKGVAVTHRSAAAFVDAEARLFLPDAPLGPGDRVLAGLSVAFDASCEEMWLAWRHGACLVPAPRDLVRTGVDLGPWLVERGVTVVSTVPTLAALWPVDALASVRLLILGGEACPAELAARLVAPGREVWNTYGPTETTVVACAARLDGTSPVRIGLPLAGWDLAVVDPLGDPVPMGESGELVIAGVGSARYLDTDKDAERFATLPSLGWRRAYRSGDVVRADAAGLRFEGRSDEQIKLGGRRIELGEVDSALQALPGVSAAAAAVRRTPAGGDLLVGYLVADPDHDLDTARARLRDTLPAALVPLLVTVPDLPVRTSGKIDRAALPWPVESAGPAPTQIDGTAGWVAARWADVLGIGPTRPDTDFFAVGGGSLAAARLVSLLRDRAPGLSVADVYAHPTHAALTARLDELGSERTTARVVTPVPRRAAAVQLGVLACLQVLPGLRWALLAFTAGTVASATGIAPWAPSLPWWALALGAVVLISPPGRLAIAACGARVLLRGVQPGSYPRAGRVHLRLWAAERLAETTGAINLTGGWLTWYARALGARVGSEVDLHTPPPVTGMLHLGRGSAVEPEVDLSGHWLDGDVLHIGPVRVGAGAVVGARATLGPGAKVGKRARVAPGSLVLDRAVPAEQSWAGVPAAPAGRAPQHDQRPPQRRRWTWAYGLTSLALELLVPIAALPALALVAVTMDGATTPTDVLLSAWIVVPATVLWLTCCAALIATAVRLLGRGLHEGVHPVHGPVAWRAWTTERLMDLARTVLFPLYASLATPSWLRLLGMRVGRGVEASTVLALPSLTTVRDGAFLADDTLVGSYELGGGRLRIARARIGKRAFLGNSGMTAPGRSVPKRGLVGVLSSAPERAQRGSSWLGMPPIELPRTTERGDEARTFAPPRRLVVARAAVELCRVVPVTIAVGLAAAVVSALWVVAVHAGVLLAVLLAGPVAALAGIVAAATAVAAKWLLVGRFRAGEHPLWSSAVWRAELADTFVEVLAVPWLVGRLDGTPLMSCWHRALGSRVGRGVWCESYWLPEADLVTIGDGATVNRGCVVQTHLFHDRILRMDRVTLGAGATLGPHTIALPATVIGANTVVGPASLVMHGESVPGGGHWLGNPIAAWSRRR